MFFKDKTCPCGIVGIEQEQNMAYDATEQIQLSFCDAWEDLGPAGSGAGPRWCSLLPTL